MAIRAGDKADMAVKAAPVRSTCHREIFLLSIIASALF
jgi:hypothetical protein